MLVTLGTLHHFRRTGGSPDGARRLLAVTAAATLALTAYASALLIAQIGIGAALSGRASPIRQERVPTAIRYSISKRARSSVPRFQSSQNPSSAASKSSARSLRTALPRAAIVGP